MLHLDNDYKEILLKRRKNLVLWSLAAICVSAKALYNLVDFVGACGVATTMQHVRNAYLEEPFMDYFMNDH